MCRWVCLLLFTIYILHNSALLQRVEKDVEDRERQTYKGRERKREREREAKRDTKTAGGM